MGKRIPRLAGGVAARHRKIDPFLCQRRRAVANVAKLPYMIAKRTDSIWWRCAQQLEGGFASFTTAPYLDSSVKGNTRRRPLSSMKVPGSLPA